MSRRMATSRHPARLLCCQDGQDEILAPQNHAHPFVSFVWDATDDRAHGTLANSWGRLRILSGSAFWDGRPSPRMRSDPCRFGSRIRAGLAIEVRWAAALLVVRASLPALPAVSSRGWSA